MTAEGNPRSGLAWLFACLLTSGAHSASEKGRCAYMRIRQGNPHGRSPVAGAMRRRVHLLGLDSIRTISRMPPWSSSLCNLYWIKRSLRPYQQAERRAIYRKIEQEKRRLKEQVGVDPEEVRLLCRYLANLQDRDAEMRWRAYAAQLKLAI